MMTPAEETTFRFFPILNTLEDEQWLTAKGKVQKVQAESIF